MTDLVWPAPAASTDGTAGIGAATAPGPRTVLLTPEGDLDLTGGRAHMIGGNRAVVQVMRSRLQVGRGEWWHDLRKGVPYFQDVLVHNPERGLLELIIQAEVRGTPGVTTIERVRINLDRPTRTATVSIAASTKRSGQVTIDRVKLRR